MTAPRIVIEEPCKHGLAFGPHIVHDHNDDGCVLDCPGGSYRILDPGSFVLIEKVDGEWPYHGTITQGWEASNTQAIHEFLDALAG